MSTLEDRQDAFLLQKEDDHQGVAVGAQFFLESANELVMIGPALDLKQ